MRLALTTDHTGVAALKELQEYLTSQGYDCVNVGPEAYDVNDDYPAYMAVAAHAVTGGDCERAIILGGSGQGEAMAANRIKGIRCALFYGPAIAKMAIDAEGDTSDDPYEILKLSRQHNDANVLSLSSRFLSLEEMKTACTVWLETPFSGLDRHARRNRQLDEV